jgi:uncharacterized membrane protein YebE (DUF533 family)
MSNFTDILGAILQSKVNRSSDKRLENVLRSGGSGSQGGLSDLFANLKGRLGDSLPQGKSGEGIGETLQRVLGDAGQAVKGNQQLAIASLGAIAAMLLGRGHRPSKGLIGGGAMAILGAIAYAAVKGAGKKEPEVPIGLREPQNSEERQQLEQHAELVIKAMVNAAKADGRIDEQEMQRISERLGEATLDEASRQRMMEELRKPISTDELAAAASGRPELGAELYAASLLAIEVDTPAEKAYMEKLASNLRLQPEVVQRLESLVGIR